MRARLVAAMLVAVVACAGRAIGADGDGICARCHGSVAADMAAYGGHGPGLDCTSCHANRRDDVFGSRHRAVPRCRDCHEQTRHPPRSQGRQAPNRNCVRCHTPHGSPNRALVRSAIGAAGGRRVAIRFDSAAGAAPGGFTDPDHPGGGLCEVCHRRTAFYRADGSGATHYTAQCTLCHQHLLGFVPQVSGANCPLCHTQQGAAFAKPSGHSAALACDGCHAAVGPEPGPGHRAIPPCSGCHADIHTHVPLGADAPCTRCHDPHGTDNIKLVLNAITTPQGAERPIVFDNLAGRSDGSFASVSAPGSGVCEICHTQTRYYRAAGGGLSHWTFSCVACHRHDRGFAKP